MMEVLKFRITGTAPLIVHSLKGLNPFDETTRRKKAINAKKTKKTDEDMLMVNYLDFSMALYMDAKHGPIVPSANVEATLRDAGKSEKLGKDVQKGLSVLDDVPILYEGPRTVDGLWEDRRFVDFRGGKVGQARVMLCHPRFDIWAIEPEVRFDTEIFNPETIVRIAVYAGRYIGLCDYRPKFGRFSVEVIEHRAEELAA